MYIYAYIYIYIYIYMYMYIYVCIYMYMQVNKKLFKKITAFPFIKLLQCLSIYNF